MRWLGGIKLNLVEEIDFVCVQMSGVWLDLKCIFWK